MRAYLPARVSQAGTPGTETLTKDIALGGMRCLSPYLSPVGSVVSVEIALPSQPDVVQLRGRTAWFRVLPESEQFDLGIAFLDMPTETKRRLSTYFERSARLSPA